MRFTKAIFSERRKRESWRAFSCPRSKEPHCFARLTAVSSPCGGSSGFFSARSSRRMRNAGSRGSGVQVCLLRVCLGCKRAVLRRLPPGYSRNSSVCRRMGAGGAERRPREPDYGDQREEGPAPEPEQVVGRQHVGLLHDRALQRRECRLALRRGIEQGDALAQVRLMKRLAPVPPGRGERGGEA